jgi:PAS domain S-box-containing protein
VPIPVAQRYTRGPRAFSLDGIITSWNIGAEHLFGYADDEVIGKSVSLLIPQGKRDEETQILARIRAAR